MLTGLLLEVAKHLSQGRLIGPYPPSTCASAASAWGSQKVMFMSW